MNDQKRILIIDDDSRNVFALSAVLRGSGFKVATASGMEEAFDVLAANTDVGIILTDMMMPGMDGYEGIAKLKADDRYKHIPTIAVTAQAMTGDKEKCLAAGADGYISKPIDVDVLMTLLGNHFK